MAWYGNDALPFAILVPAAAAGLLLPFLGRKVDCRLSALGTTTAFAILSSALTKLGLGASVLGTIWALAGLLSLSDVRSSRLRLPSHYSFTFLHITGGLQPARQQQNDQQKHHQHKMTRLSNKIVHHAVRFLTTKVRGVR